MAALPPPFARARHLLLATLAAAAVGSGLGYLVHVWPAPEPLRTPFAYDVPTTVGAAEVDGTAPGWGGPGIQRPRHCLQSLDAWMRTTSWEISIALFDGESPGWSSFLTITSTGHAAISSGTSMARAVFFGPLQLERLRQMSAASCVGLPSRPSHLVVRLQSTPGKPAAWIYEDSEAYDRLIEFMAEATYSREPTPTPLRLPEP